MKDGTKLASRDITSEDRADYLRLIYEGHAPDQAARQLGSTGSAFRKFRNPVSESYDPEFAEAFRAAITSEAHEQNRLEHIRDLVWAKAEGGDGRMIEKLALIYDPDWAALRHQNFLNVNIIARMMPYFSTAELERALAEAEREDKDLVEGSAVRQLPSPRAA